MADSDQEIKSLREYYRREITSLSEQLQVERNRYDELVKRNEERLDGYIAINKEIVEQRLGLGAPKVVQGTTPKPINLRPKPWKSVAATFEAEQRAKMWKEKIKKVEEQDKQAQNSVSVQKDEVQQDLDELEA